MKQRNLNQSVKRMLKVAACCALGATVAFPNVAYAEPLLAEQSAQVKVTGNVVDAQGEPIIGASVVVKGAKTGVATDIDGNFSTQAANGQEITVTYIGYRPYTFTVTGASSYNIVLQEDSQLLNDVVVIGYGTQRKGDVTSAVASVKAEDFTLGAIGDASELVKGKIAGLTISKGNGDPNAESTIRLRGVISLEGGSTPLVLIDGIEGGLGTVAPENIESIDVLKDASAAAIYGTRGANGVILITTKSGKREANTTATYSGYVSWSKMGKKHEFMSADQIRQGLTSYTDRGYDTDWMDAITRTAFTHNHDFQISGGNKTTSYAGGVNYRRAEGVIIDTFNDELKMNFDLAHWFFNDMIKVHLNMVKGIHKNSAIGIDNGQGDASIYLQALMRNPTEPIYAPDGTYYEDFGRLYYWNPVGMIKEKTGGYKSEWSRMTGDITVEPIKGWQTTLMLSTNRSNSHNQTYYTSEYYSEKSENHTGQASQSYGYSRSDNLEATSRYRKTFKDIHRFEALLGYSWQKNTYEGFNAYNRDFASDFFQYNNMGLGQQLKEGKAGMGSYKNENTLVGFFGRVSYGYDNRYNLLVSVRREGSSKFGANHKWGNFPSVSAGWNIMNEEFWKSMPEWWNDMRLRVGYGVTGVIPNDPYQSLTRYAYDSYFYDGGKWVQGLTVVSNPNPDLKWETSHEWNIGLDFGFFNDRLSGNIDLYRKTTKDMLWWYDVPVPPNVYSQTLANVGEMRNMGVEVLIKGVPVQTKDFEWTSTLTVSHNANKLISLSNDLYETANQHPEGGLGQPISQSTHRLEVGKSVGNFYGIKSVGVSENGLWLFEEPDGTVRELQDDDLADEAVKQYLGNGLPKIYLGWGNTFRYKDFDLSMQFTGQFGHKILNEARAFYENNSIAYNKLVSVLEAPYGGDRCLAPNQKQTFVSYYLENGDFLKLTNLTLGYTVPLKQNKWISGIRAYLAAENLFTITKYKGLDPELSNGYAPAAGIEYRSNYPTVRSFTVGLNLTF